MNLPGDPLQPPPPFQQPYAPPPPAFGANQQPTTDRAVAGMVLGIVGLFLGFLWVVLPILAVTATAGGAGAGWRSPGSPRASSAWASRAWCSSSCSRREGDFGLYAARR